MWLCVPGYEYASTSFEATAPMRRVPHPALQLLLHLRLRSVPFEPHLGICYIEGAASKRSYANTPFEATLQIRHAAYPAFHVLFDLRLRSVPLRTTPSSMAPRGARTNAQMIMDSIAQEARARHEGGGDQLYSCSIVLKITFPK